MYRREEGGSIMRIRWWLVFPVLALAGGAVFLTQARRSQTHTPRAALEAFLRAQQQGDRRAMRAFSTRDSWPRVDSLDRLEALPNAIIGQNIEEDPETGGYRARVDAQFSDTVRPYIVVQSKQGDPWKVDVVASIAKVLGEQGKRDGSRLKAWGKGLGRRIEHTLEGAGEALGDVARGAQRGTEKFNQSLHKEPEATEAIDDRL
jgi:hypothetical protein